MVQFLKTHVWFCTLLSFLILFYFIGLGSYPLLSSDETRYASVAKELWLQKQYVTPTLNHFIFLDKPILYYWLTAFAFKLFGTTAFAARFFPAVLGLASVTATYFFADACINRRVAILASCILATSSLFWGAAHYSNMDMIVASFLTLSLYAFYVGVNKSSRLSYLWTYLSYILAALAFLTKGLIGFVFPCMIIGLWILISWQWHIVRRMKLFSGLLLFFIIIFPWVYLVSEKNPEFFHFFFIVQQTSRYLTDHFNSQEPFWFYPAIICIGLLPWTIWLPQALYTAIKKVFNKEHSLDIYLLVWFFTILIFFSMPVSKLIGYIVPVLPPASLLIAMYLDKCWAAYSTVLKKTVIILAIFQIVLLSVLFTLIIRPYAAQRSLLPVIKTIMPYLKNNQTKLVVFYDYFYDLSFYTNKRLYAVANWDTSGLIEEDNWKGRFLFAVLHHPEEKSYLLSSEDLVALCHAEAPMVIVLKERAMRAYPCEDYQRLAVEGEYLALGQNLPLRQR